MIHAVWSSLPLPALIVDPANRIAEINPAAEAFLNASARSLKGQPFLDRLAIDAPMEAALARARAGEAALFINAADVSTGTAPPQPCDIQLAPLSGAEGHVLVTLAPRHIASRLGQRQTPAGAARSAIGMAEMLSHEIRNPLAGITGAAQLLEMNLAPQDRELTGLILAETRRILALLAQVDEFGNLAPPRREAWNVHDLLDRARRSAELGVAASLTVVEDYDPSLPPAWVDGDQMIQVIQNLLKNAAEAAPGGRVTIRTFYEPSLRIRDRDGRQLSLPLQVEIIDNGPGIPPEIAADIFEPFVSGRENGTGLGLALVAKIIAAHDAWIAVESRPGRTAFRLSLPLPPAEARATKGQGADMRSGES
ncbi:two-component system, NtrC family, nitrogen regulation sensor histidine kinase GlnL [Meinhardsimonia xiamenensis]|jgi:two-component system nitrogen regulation sensor histidine kinase GlnL|uniref:histidine kinase n=1 Tax=Meinhardsimonia xiamenensis TaxID=990712 RepID=A0A1G9GP99_9RHOB|nr:ATP-binding protein [Meinhardsimonia xiamenensis]PRX30520.1 two-component system nitrogen regulation sensor histidine kinase GlnL [Meinhardsimonia xiamenensis]SDL02487.1 two-component system, NtrC family, nitrogen regulation sensor histidine kinase GlnL [Meinhardsimonia xiamenensis]